jgi:hypothetical protein
LSSCFFFASTSLLPCPASPFAITSFSYSLIFPFTDIDFSCRTTYYSEKVYLTDFHSGELPPCCFSDSSISSRKYCWGPSTDPGLQSLIHPMKSAALKW